MTIRSGTTVLLSVFLMTIAGCAANNTPMSPAAPTTKPSLAAVVASGGIVRHDVPYVTGGTPLQTMDIYAPAGAHAAAVIIYVHGGEWAKGDKSEVAYKPAFLVEHRVILASINYRLSGTDHHPAQVDDICSAVRWVRQHADELGADANKIFLMGHSAGCHLVTLAALDPRPLARAGLKPSDLAGVVTWSGGAYDLVEKVNEGGMYAGYIHKNFGDDEKVWRDASPIAHTNDFRPLPPFLMVSAQNDKAPSIAASDRLAGLIRQAGGSAQRETLPGKDHGSADHDLGMPGDSSGALLIKFIGGR